MLSISGSGLKGWDTPEIKRVVRFYLSNLISLWMNSNCGMSTSSKPNVWDVETLKKDPIFKFLSENQLHELVRYGCEIVNHIDVFLENVSNTVVSAIHGNLSVLSQKQEAVTEEVGTIETMNSDTDTRRMEVEITSSLNPRFRDMYGDQDTSHTWIINSQGDSFLSGVTEKIVKHVFSSEIHAVKIYTHLSHGYFNYIFRVRNQTEELDHGGFKFRGFFIHAQDLRAVASLLKKMVQSFNLPFLSAADSERRVIVAMKTSEGGVESMIIGAGYTSPYGCPKALRAIFSDYKKRMKFADAVFRRIFDE